MSDGWAMILVRAGYVIQHEHSTKGTFSTKESIDTVIYKDGREVLRLNQNFDGRGGTSLAGVYRAAALKLGLAKAKHDAPYPVDLTVEKKHEGTVHEEDVYKHPSFGVITLGRYSGGSKHFMSPIETFGGYTIHVSSAHLSHNTSLGTERVFSNHDTLIEIDMSFTQFAEFITSQGQGAGVPCTIKHDGVLHVQPCELNSAEERLEDNARVAMNEAVEGIQRMLKEFDDEMGGPGSLGAKRKQEIWAELRKAMHDIAGKPQWLLRIWKEHVNETLSHAKSEFAHWANIRSMQQSLPQGEGPKPLPERTDED